MYICNLALGHLGLPFITSLETVSSTVASTCNQYYDHCRKVVIQSHFWKFATKRKIISPLSETPVSDYTYAFTYPSDCLRLEIVVRGDPLPEEKYDVNNGKILCNESSLSLKYIFDNKNTAVYSIGFTNSLSLYLAFSMSSKLKGVTDNTLYARYEMTLKDATASDSGESNDKSAKGISSWEQARIGRGFYNSDPTMH